MKHERQTMGRWRRMPGVAAVTIAATWMAAGSVRGQAAVETEPAPQMALRQAPELQIANAYGLPGWEQVEAITFTFNVKRPEGQPAMARQWTWRPKDRRVTRGEGDAAITFTHPLPADEASPEAVAADKQFVNDSYWFLFPFQIVWSNPQVTEQGEQALPIPPADGDPAAARKVTVQFPDQGGYTPGDAYDLYLDDHHRIMQWVFRRGGGANGSPVTWEGNAQLGPIIAALEHRGADGELRLWFTDVTVTVRDEQGQTATHVPEPVKE